MKIAIIGAGSVGKTLGTALEAKGHDIAYGTRDPDRAAVRHAKTVVQALAGAEVVILATPWVASEAVVCAFADELAGKIVIDATNPINPTLTRLTVGFNTSGAELLQSQARGAKFYKALNTTGIGVMAKPHFTAGDFALIMARRDAANRNAKPRVRVVDPHPQEAE